ncbi:uncharacterized protein LOC135231455 [Loxodonta africana]|uniref:uncharacterized protein LOC135231455 n=1 Tax=Loxodonta africana TaxID=9785 RepID=UPI0030D55667
MVPGWLPAGGAFREGARRLSRRRALGGGGRGGHSCSLTGSPAPPTPPYLLAPQGSPRLPAVGSGAGGELEDARGGEQRFKRSASSLGPPPGAAGAAGMESRKGCRLSRSRPAFTEGLRAGREGLGGEDRDRGAKREGLSEARPGEVSGQVIHRDPSRPAYPTMAELIPAWGALRAASWDRPPTPARILGLTVATSAASGRSDGTRVGGAPLRSGPHWVRATAGRRLRTRAAAALGPQPGLRPQRCWSRPLSERPPLRPASAPPAAAAVVAPTSTGAVPPPRQPWPDRAPQCRDRVPTAARPPINAGSRPPRPHPSVLREVRRPASAAELLGLQPPARQGPQPPQPPVILAPSPPPSSLQPLQRRRHPWTPPPQEVCPIPLQSAPPSVQKAFHPCGCLQLLQKLQ